MKALKKSFTGVIFTLSVACQADTVIQEVVDTRPGQYFGSTIGFMIGATGGPAGALAAGGISWLLGGKIQETSGLAGKAYRVEKEDGSTVVVRSPNKAWQPKDKVNIVNGRLKPLTF